MVLRFGRYVKTVTPGPHWIPPVIEKRFTVNVQKISQLPYQAEMLTQDENIVSVALTVLYRIEDPNKFLFNVVNPMVTLQQATSSALRQVVGQMTLNTVLTTGRQELRDKVAKQLDKTLAIYQTGIDVTDVTLQPAKPPEAVTHAFDDAIKAREDEQRYINQAKAYARKVESIVKGQTARLTQSANAYKQEVVLRSRGATARYLALLKPYQRAPEVTRKRLYLDTMALVLSHTTNIIMDTSNNNIMYLPLNEILRNQRQTKQKQMAGNSSENLVMKPGLSGNSQMFNRPSYPVEGGQN